MYMLNIFSLIKSIPIKYIVQFQAIIIIHMKRNGYWNIQHILDFVGDWQMRHAKDDDDEDDYDEKKWWNNRCEPMKYLPFPPLG